MAKFLGYSNRKDVDVDTLWSTERSQVLKIRKSFENSRQAMEISRQHNKKTGFAFHSSGYLIAFAPRFLVSLLYLEDVDVKIQLQKYATG